MRVRDLTTCEALDSAVCARNNPTCAFGMSALRVTSTAPCVGKYSSFVVRNAYCNNRAPRKHSYLSDSLFRKYDNT